MVAQPNLSNLLKALKIRMFKKTQIIEKGIIRHINGNRTTVEIVKANLEECKSCGSCTDIKNEPNFIEIETSPGLILGQRVVLQIIDTSPYKSIILLLILPIVSLLIGSLTGQKIHFIYPQSQNIRMISCGFVFFFLSIMFLGIYDKKIRNKNQAHRKITLILT
ncbi:MAG: SoxR reducing system RseC family protein [Planctomycetes bacterium]|nr:SoxR reducing system RseC family protein [Planctomycetota bacterium]